MIASFVYTFTRYDVTRITICHLTYYLVYLPPSPTPYYPSLYLCFGSLTVLPIPLYQGKSINHFLGAMCTCMCVCVAYHLAHDVASHFVWFIRKQHSLHHTRRIHTCARTHIYIHALFGCCPLSLMVLKNEEEFSFVSPLHEIEIHVRSSTFHHH